MLHNGISFSPTLSAGDLFLLHSVLAGGMALERCPFRPGYQICWHIIVHSILLFFGNFCSIHWDFSFHFLFCLSEFFSLLFLVRLSRKFVKFVYPFNSWFYWFFPIVFWIPIIDFLSDLYNCLPSATIDFVGSCSNFLGWAVSLRFFFILRKACAAVDFPLSTAFVVSQDFG